MLGILFSACSYTAAVAKNVFFSPLAYIQLLRWAKTKFFFALRVGKFISDIRLPRIQPRQKSSKTWLRAQSHTSSQLKQLVGRSVWRDEVSAELPGLEPSILFLVKNAWATVLLFYSLWFHLLLAVTANLLGNQYKWTYFGAAFLVRTP